MINNGNVILDFYAPWCGPCKALAPIFADLAAHYSHITFLKINGDKFGSLMSRYGIKSYPTLIFSKNGARLEMLLGSKSRQSLESVIKKHFGN